MYTFPFTSAYPVAGDYSQISSFTNGNTNTSTGNGGTTIANGYMTLEGETTGADRMPMYETLTAHRKYSVGFDAFFDSVGNNGTIFGGQEVGGRFGLLYSSTSTLGIYHSKDAAHSTINWGTTSISVGEWYNIKIVIDTFDYVKIYLDNELYLYHALTGINWGSNIKIDSWYFGEKDASNYGVGGVRIKNFDVYEGLWSITE